MTKSFGKWTLFGGWLLLTGCGLLAAGKKEKVRQEVAVMDTNLGRITFRFYSEESPKSVTIFKTMARTGLFNGTLINKVLPGLLIQGGDTQTKHEPVEQDIEIEKNNLKHHAGTVSLAYRKGASAGESEFFICLQEVSYFDGKHNIIGEVISGLKVVDAISNVPRNLKQFPLHQVRIQRISLEEQEFLREVR
jgi:peptidyl-prolyl cis-trans isomerase B (cyclophilin B)